MTHTYFLGYQQVKFLLSTPGISEQEKAAIRRLDELKGDARDLETAARLYDYMGYHEHAEALRRMLVSPNKVPCTRRGEAMEIVNALRGMSPDELIESLDEEVYRLTTAIQKTQRDLLGRMERRRKND